MEARAYRDLQLLLHCLKMVKIIAYLVIKFSAVSNDLNTQFNVNYYHALYFLLC